MTTPDYKQLDELGRRAQESQDTCEMLIQQIRTALMEVSEITVLKFYQDMLRRSCNAVSR